MARAIFNLILFFRMFMRILVLICRNRHVKPHISVDGNVFIHLEDKQFAQISIHDCYLNLFSCD